MIELSIVFFFARKKQSKLTIDFRMFLVMFFLFFFFLGSFYHHHHWIIESFQKNNGIHGQMLNHRNGSLVSNFFIIVWLSMKKKQYNQSINEPLATNRSRFNFFFFLSLIISYPLPNQIIFFFGVHGMYIFHFHFHSHILLVNYLLTKKNQSSFLFDWLIWSINWNFINSHFNMWNLKLSPFRVWQYWCEENQKRKRRNHFFQEFFFVEIFSINKQKKRKNFKETKAQKGTTNQSNRSIIWYKKNQNFQSSNMRKIFKKKKFSINKYKCTTKQKSNER